LFIYAVMTELGGLRSVVDNQTVQIGKLQKEVKDLKDVVGITAANVSAIKKVTVATATKFTLVDFTMLPLVSNTVEAWEKELNDSEPAKVKLVSKEFFLIFHFQFSRFPFNPLLSCVAKMERI
jgi:hypothetical protein